MTWKDISVGKYIDLFNINMNDFDSIFEYKRETASIIFDIPQEEIDDMDIDEFDEQFKFLFIEESDSIKINYPSILNKDSIFIQGIDLYFFNNFNYITLAEWIDIDYYLTNDSQNNLTKILSILYRQKTIKNSILFPDEFEPYGLWARHRSNLFLDIPIEDVYGAISKFISWREAIIEKYNGLFGGGQQGNDEDLSEQEKEMLTDTEQKQLKGEIEKEKKMKKWNIELFLKRISDDDLTKVEDLLKLNAIFVFNWLSVSVEVGAN